MKMKRLYLLLLAVIILSPIYSKILAEDVPTISPTIIFTNTDSENEGTDTTASAPLAASFHANVKDLGSYTPYYEWRFYVTGSEDNPYLVRYTENTDYTFTTSGTTYIVLYATFIQGNDTVAYTADYWNENKPMSVTISQSKMEVPNAFSPNGDGINDIFKVKDGYQSLTEFHAYIFNRWGQKLYEWSDPAGGWDGTFNGHDAKQGVYFVLIKAKGADGIQYNIKRDVNLLRGYTEDSSSSSNSSSK
jgi:gliding motility-associated-like protein